MRQNDQEPQPTLSDVASQLSEAREDFIIALAGNAYKCRNLPAGGAIPDYAGQAYVLIAEDVVAALQSGSREQFERLYPTFVYLARVLYGRRLEDLPEDADAWSLLHASFPYEDALLVSGLAILYDELDGGEFSDLVYREWGKWLDAFEDEEARKRLFEFLVGIATARAIGFTSPRYHRRFYWKLHVRDELESRGVATEPIPYLGRDPPDPSGGHPSPIIRAWARWQPIQEEPGQLFVVLLADRRDEAQDVELPEDLRRFKERLDEAFEEEEEGANGGDNDGP